MVKKKIILGLAFASLASLIFVGGKNIFFSNDNEEIKEIHVPFEIQESTVAEDDIFSKGRKSFGAGKLRYAKDSKEDKEHLTKPKIGYQMAHNEDGTKVSIRFTAAINSLNVKATWKRAMYDSNGDVYEPLIEADKSVTTAYTALINGENISYAVDELDDLGNKPFNYYVVYTLLNVPIEGYGSYFLDAFLTLSDGEDEITSKVGAIELNNTKRFSYERGTNEDLAFTMDEENKSYKVKGKNTSNDDVVIPGYYSDGHHRYVVNEIESDGFKDHTNIKHIEVPETIETVGENAFKGSSNAHIHNRKDKKGEKWHDNWNPDKRPHGWQYIGYKGETEDFVYDISRDGNKLYSTILGYIGTSKEVEIPSEINNIPVKVIGPSSFRNSTITSIKFPDSVETIENAAFYQSSLKSIKFGNGLNKIGDYAFYESSRYQKMQETRIEFPSSLKEIGDYAFNIVGKDIEYYIPSSVEYVGKYAFAYNYNYSFQIFYLENSSIPDTWDSSWYSLYSDNYLIFYNCSREDEIIRKSGIFSYYLDENENAILLKVDNVETRGEITIPECLDDHKIVGMTPYTFSSNNAGKITIEAEINEISNYGFDSCYYLKEVILPNTIREIGDCAFSSCPNLESIDLINIERIGDNAFSNCSSLKEVYIPNSVEYIGYDAFYGCSNINILCEAESKPEAWDDNWAGNSSPFVSWGIVK